MEFYRLDIGLKLDVVYLLEGTIQKYAFHVGFSHSFAQLERKCSLKALCVRFAIIWREEKMLQTMLTLIPVF